MTATHPLPDRFDPGSVQEFRYVSRSLDPGTGVAELRYALDELELVERFTFPMPAGPVPAARREAAMRLLDHLWLVAGLSYYKLAAPPVVSIEAGAFHESDIALHRLLLTRGLGEFCFVNGLDPELRPAYRWTSLAAAPAPVTGLAADRGPLVPVGGGKDSCVTIEALRHAGFDPTLVTVRRFPIIQDVIDASGLPDLAVERVLDPMLRALNDRGALNGHVPATAIVSFAVLVTAALHGFDAVLMSNERSASEGNVSYRGVDINHQWSKSDEAEIAIAAAVARVSPELVWASLLRPLSELHISQLFAQWCGRYLGTFSSCNRSQVMDAAVRVRRWCGQCPKCQFVYLALATSLPRATLEEIFGSELFASSPIEGFRSLLGLTAWKPFECVGESGECRVALSMLSRSAEWAEHPIICALIDEVRAAGTWASADEERAVFSPWPTAAAIASSGKYAHILTAVGAGAAG